MAPKFNKYEQPAYWTQNIQYVLNGMLHAYLKDNKLSQTELAERLGVSKGYISQILNGNFDHKLSKLVELALSCEMVPKFEFVPLSKAEQVAKEAYLSPKDWVRYKEFFNAIEIQQTDYIPELQFEDLNNFQNNIVA